MGGIFDSPKSASVQTQTEITIDIPSKEKELTNKIQMIVDNAFANTAFAYEVEVVIMDASSGILTGFLGVYPVNSQSWNLLSLSQKKDLVATFVTVARDNINSVGQVYVKNNIRTLAEGSWSSWSGEAKIEIK